MIIDVTMAQILQTMLAAKSQNSRGENAGAESVPVIRVVFEEFEDIWGESSRRGGRRVRENPDVIPFRDEKRI